MQTILVALCQAAPSVISMLEDHYSAVRHTDGALTLEQLDYCNWSVVSRIPCERIFAPMVWKVIMCVSPEAIAEFAWNLARWLALHYMPKVVVLPLAQRVHYQVRRVIVDFNRQAKSSQMTENDVIDLMDVCCVFVYLQGQIPNTFGTAVQDQFRSLWLEGLRS